ncbi:HpcH/HpaI aldolase/citrate lyase family protein [Psychrobacter sp. AOP22-C1-22]|uniref:HpcH/HpaI aldolase/citrate lyase family protein n=1 Tax=unclassified Psychrobacter TaxID=196806 RepID=UPI001788611B|nr:MULTISPECIES: CoA ester lyase [unclassified Psychrobacter]MDN5801404.1 CoA ester lyase [Psychrobacter sp.]MBE0406499.1 CoA ester lyase [Psychrobacter sp. FME6]MBE0444670.1 CoA ester lyase [Psychrobacter sp. FME5]MDN5891400.1 CoA ester lyase [Psychrobacter sp.]MDN5897894.1 CoA ester lyase [Psychrobacter sp.]
MQTSIDKDTTALTVGLSNIHTWLFVPATRMERVTKAFASGADAVIVDLEDTIAQADKAQARDALREYYLSSEYQPVWIRINQAGSTDYAEDIKLCEQLPNLAGIILPKAEQAADIEYIHHLSGLSVIALVESAVGLYNLDNMASASGLVAFSYGFLDLCNDLQVQVGTAAADIIANQIRYQLLISSKVHQLSAPIDTVYPEFNDSEGLSQRVQLWSQMGMSGMLCIHPKQVATVKESLRPLDAEIDFAKRVIAEYERTGKAVFKVEGNMIDAPVIQRCLQLLGK